jgi:hypothetical protein
MHAIASEVLFPIRLGLQGFKQIGNRKMVGATGFDHRRVVVRFRLRARIGEAARGNRGYNRPYGRERATSGNKL